MGRMDGKVAVILGVTDVAGIGAAIARTFTAEGARVVLGGLCGDEAKVIAAKLGGTGAACDIMDDSTLSALADLAVVTYGRLDVAVNCAGVNSGALIADITREALTLASDVHFVGTTLFIKHMAARMTAGGSIITTSSVTAILAHAGLAAYAGSKRAADQVVRIAAVEYGPANIRVNALAPGLMETPMTRERFTNPHVRPAFERETPLGRLPTTDDVARTALWLATDAFTTGQLIDVTGGLSLRRLPLPSEIGPQA